MFTLTGLNHNTATVDIRERLSFSPDTIVDALEFFQAKSDVDGIAILSTCNRTEIYMESSISRATLQAWLCEWHNIQEIDIAPFLYQYQDLDAAKHMMKVACGLDSLVLGEPQILGQLKTAYSLAQQAGSLSTSLHQSFQHCLSVAKRVRTETAIGENPVSVAFAAVSLAKQVFADLTSKTALVIGAGETIRLVAQHLKDQQIKRLIVVNRTLTRAQELAKEVGAEAMHMSDLHKHLHLADICVSSTAAPVPILGKGAVESALQQRKNNMMFMVDLAVPRDIEPEVVNLEDVYLFTVDDLSDVIEENKRSRQQAAEHAMEIIDKAVEGWHAERRARSQTDIIRLYRHTHESLRDAELALAQRQLERGENPSEVLQRFANNLTKKFMHSPTVGLSQALRQGDETLLNAGQQLLGLADIAPKNELNQSRCDHKRRHS